MTSSSAKSRIKGSWGGFARDRLFELKDGSVWQQDEDYYEFRFAHQPEVEIEESVMSVGGLKRAVRVRKIR